jgi:hypothetical protein
MPKTEYFVVVGMQHPTIERNERNMIPSDDRREYGKIHIVKNRDPEASVSFLVPNTDKPY